MGSFKFLHAFFFFFIILGYQEANGEIPKKTQKSIDYANKNGPYIGLVIPNTFEMNPLLDSKHFSSSFNIDFGGRRFRFGTLAKKKVILVMTGLGMGSFYRRYSLERVQPILNYQYVNKPSSNPPSDMYGKNDIGRVFPVNGPRLNQPLGEFNQILNAGVTTQLLASLFDLEGIVHYGIAGNANPSLNIGDVTISKYWAHTGLWNWQRYGDGPKDELSLESNGDYSRDIGYLRFADFTTPKTKSDNLLNYVWYQREEVFVVDGVPEQRQHAFWLPVDSHYFNISKTYLQGVKLNGCINSTTCLSTTPKVSIVERGISADIFVDNAAYRTFLHNKFKASPIDMETAAVALISFQQKKPFIAFRALSDLAGGGSASSNEASTFSSLAVDNSVKVVIRFIQNL